MAQIHTLARRGADRPPLPLADLLGAVDHRRGTRLELLCWQLNVDEVQVEPAWRVAIRERLLARRGADPHTGEPLYALTERGRRALLRLRARRGAAVQRP
jgi:hypothetical protein